MIKQRRHGLQWPPNLSQAASVVLFAFISSCFYAFLVPLVEPGSVRVLLLVAFTVVFAATVALDLAAAGVDPSDPGINNPGEPNAGLYCVTCQAGVGSNSKHCKKCDRCVELFDHHCVWLNNCVGKANYHYFFGLLCSAMLLLVMDGSLCSYLLLRSFTDRANLEARLDRSHDGRVHLTGVQVALGIQLAVVLVAGYLVGELLVFHIVLISRGLTTYEYILVERGRGTSAASRAVPQSGLCGCACCSRKRQVLPSVQADRAASRPSKVGLNPCRALRTDKQLLVTGSAAGNGHLMPRVAPTPDTGAAAARHACDVPELQLQQPKAAAGNAPRSIRSPRPSERDCAGSLTGVGPGVGPLPEQGEAAGGGGAGQPGGGEAMDLRYGIMQDSVAEMRPPSPAAPSRAAPAAVAEGLVADAQEAAAQLHRLHGPQTGPAGQPAAGSGLMSNCRRSSGHTPRGLPVPPPLPQLPPAYSNATQEGVARLAPLPAHGAHRTV